MQVFSVSYGDDENTIDVDYIMRVNAVFQQLALRGVTLLVGSGNTTCTTAPRRFRLLSSILCQCRRPWGGKQLQ
jgi:hypothetical protein